MLAPDIIATIFTATEGAEIACVTVAPDESIIFAQGTGICWYDVVEGQPHKRHALTGHSAQVIALQLHEDALYSVASNGEVFCWRRDQADSYTVNRRMHAEGIVSCVEMSLPRHIALGMTNGCVFLYGPREPREQVPLALIGSWCRPIIRTKKSFSSLYRTITAIHAMECAKNVYLAIVSSLEATTVCKIPVSTGQGSPKQPQQNDLDYMDISLSAECNTPIDAITHIPERNSRHNHIVVLGHRSGSVSLVRLEIPDRAGHKMQARMLDLAQLSEPAPKIGIGTGHGVKAVALCQCAKHLIILTRKAVVRIVSVHKLHDGEWSQLAVVPHRGRALGLEVLPHHEGCPCRARIYTLLDWQQG
ncbi:hypothetical protein GMRT_23232 [Giardia muris]|uniref:WD40 repeat protein n=1 Tax=Giardia muris TaxID=5742 RepID=A0A4Z1SVM7_GIAMU|nr:hypothetical protein GMRT_23232 [Giardia muris]|eukprot:TNJ27638.1 hypothetical protein GMRT_23232 [Giardia muris]